MNRALWPIAACLVLSACGDSRFNPTRWFGGERAPRVETLAPPKGYQEKPDSRLPVAQVLSAKWEQTVEGRLLVVTAIAPTKGWWDVALVPETPQPADRIRPDADGVLRLRLVGAPPAADSTTARMPAQPGVDTLTVAFPLSSTALRDIGTVVVTGGTNAVSLGV